MFERPKRNTARLSNNIGITSKILVFILSVAALSTVFFFYQVKTISDTTTEVQKLTCPTIYSTPMKDEEFVQHWNRFSTENNKEWKKASKPVK